MFAGTGNPLGTSVLLIQPLLGVQGESYTMFFLTEAENLLVGFPFDFVHGDLCLSCSGVAACVQAHGLLGSLPSRVGDEKEKSALGLSCISQGVSSWLGNSCGIAGGEDDV